MTRLWPVVLTVLALVLSACTGPARPKVEAMGAQTVASSSKVRKCGFDAKVNGAPQVVWVKTRGTYATIHACSRRTDGTYVANLGPIAARIGKAGLAAPGRKREGDLRTPAGVFPLRDGFGTVGDPGLRLGWLRTDRRDVWVDDPKSKLYNTHQRTPVRGRWTSAEQLAIKAYTFSQVIGYNEKRVPGLGSAIFLHVGTGGPTAGCVATSTSALRTLFRWERPGAVMVIS